MAATWLSKTLVPSGVVEHVVCGNFVATCQPGHAQVVLLHAGSNLELLAVGASGAAASVCSQPLQAGDAVVDMRVLPRAARLDTTAVAVRPCPDPDSLLLLTGSGRVTVLRFDEQCNRFVLVQEVLLTGPGTQPRFQPRLMATSPSGRHGVAIAAFQDRIFYLPPASLVASTPPSACAHTHPSASTATAAAGREAGGSPRTTPAAAAGAEAAGGGTTTTTTTAGVPAASGGGAAVAGRYPAVLSNTPVPYIHRRPRGAAAPPPVLTAGPVAGTAPRDLRSATVDALAASDSRFIAGSSFLPLLPEAGFGAIWDLAILEGPGLITAGRTGAGASGGGGNGGGGGNLVELRRRQRREPGDEGAAVVDGGSSGARGVDYFRVAALVHRSSTDSGEVLLLRWTRGSPDLLLCDLVVCLGGCSPPAALNAPPDDAGTRRASPRPAATSAPAGTTHGSLAPAPASATRPRPDSVIGTRFGPASGAGAPSSSSLSPPPPPPPPPGAAPTAPPPPADLLGVGHLLRAAPPGPAAAGGQAEDAGGLLVVGTHGTVFLMAALLARHALPPAGSGGGGGTVSAAAATPATAGCSAAYSSAAAAAAAAAALPPPPVLYLEDLMATAATVTLAALGTAYPAAVAARELPRCGGDSSSSSGGDGGGGGIGGSTDDGDDDVFDFCFPDLHFRRAVLSPLGQQPVRGQGAPERAPAAASGHGWAYLRFAETYFGPAAAAPAATAPPGAAAAAAVGAGGVHAADVGMVRVSAGDGDGGGGGTAAAMDLDDDGENYARRGGTSSAAGFGGAYGGGGGGRVDRTAAGEEEDDEGTTDSRAASTRILPRRRPRRLGALHDAFLRYRATESQGAAAATTAAAAGGEGSRHGDSLRDRLAPYSRGGRGGEEAAQEEEAPPPPPPPRFPPHAAPLLQLLNRDRGTRPLNARSLRTMMDPEHLRLVRKRKEGADTVSARAAVDAATAAMAAIAAAALDEQDIHGARPLPPLKQAPPVLGVEQLPFAEPQCKGHICTVAEWLSAPIPPPTLPPPPPPAPPHFSGIARAASPAAAVAAGHAPPPPPPSLPPPASAFTSRVNGSGPDIATAATSRAAAAACAPLPPPQRQLTHGSVAQMARRLLLCSAAGPALCLTVTFPTFSTPPPVPPPVPPASPPPEKHRHGSPVAAAVAAEYGAADDVELLDAAAMGMQPNISVDARDLEHEEEGGDPGGAAEGDVGLPQLPEVGLFGAACLMPGAAAIGAAAAMGSSSAAATAAASMSRTTVRPARAVAVLPSWSGGILVWSEEGGDVLTMRHRHRALAPLPSHEQQLRRRRRWRQRQPDQQQQQPQQEQLQQRTGRRQLQRTASHVRRPLAAPSAPQMRSPPLAQSRWLSSGFTTDTAAAAAAAGTCAAPTAAARATATLIGFARSSSSSLPTSGGAVGAPASSTTIGSSPPEVAKGRRHVAPPPGVSGRAAGISGGRQAAAASWATRGSGGTGNVPGGRRTKTSALPGRGGGLGRWSCGEGGGGGDGPGPRRPGGVKEAAAAAAGVLALRLLGRVPQPRPMVDFVVTEAAGVSGRGRMLQVTGAVLGLEAPGSAHSPPHPAGGTAAPEHKLQVLRGCLAAPVVASVPNQGAIPNGLWSIPLRTAVALCTSGGALGGGSGAPQPPRAAAAAAAAAANSLPAGGSLVVLSYVGGSRALAPVLDTDFAAESNPGGSGASLPYGDVGPADVAPSMCDVTEALQLRHWEPTLAAGLVAESVLVQITPSGVLLVSLDTLANPALAAAAAGAAAASAAAAAATAPSGSSVLPDDVAATGGGGGGGGSSWDAPLARSTWPSPKSSRFDDRLPLEPFLIPPQQQQPSTTLELQLQPQQQQQQVCWQGEPVALSPRALAHPTASPSLSVSAGMPYSTDGGALTERPFQVGFFGQAAEVAEVAAAATAGGGGCSESRCPSISGYSSVAEGMGAMVLASDMLLDDEVQEGVRSTGDNLALYSPDILPPPPPLLPSSAPLPGFGNAAGDTAAVEGLAGLRRMLSMPPPPPPQLLTTAAGSQMSGGPDTGGGGGASAPAEAEVSPGGVGWWSAAAPDITLGSVAPGCVALVRKLDRRITVLGVVQRGSLGGGGGGGDGSAPSRLSRKRPRSTVTVRELGCSPPLDCEPSCCALRALPPPPAQPPPPRAHALHTFRRTPSASSSAFVAAAATAAMTAAAAAAADAVDPGGAAGAAAPAVHWGVGLPPLPPRTGPISSCGPAPATGAATPSSPAAAAAAAAAAGSSTAAAAAGAAAHRAPWRYHLLVGDHAPSIQLLLLTHGSSGLRCSLLARISTSVPPGLGPSAGPAGPLTASVPESVLFIAPAPIPMAAAAVAAGRTAGGGGGGRLSIANRWGSPGTSEAVFCLVGLRSGGVAAFSYGAPAATSEAALAAAPSHYRASSDGAEDAAACNAGDGSDFDGVEAMENDGPEAAKAQVVHSVAPTAAAEVLRLVWHSPLEQVPLRLTSLAPFRPWQALAVGTAVHLLELTSHSGRLLCSTVLPASGKWAPDCGTSKAANTAPPHPLEAILAVPMHLPAASAATAVATTAAAAVGGEAAGAGFDAFLQRPVRLPPPPPPPGHPGPQELALVVLNDGSWRVLSLQRLSRLGRQPPSVMPLGPPDGVGDGATRGSVGNGVSERRPASLPVPGTAPLGRPRQLLFVPQLLPALSSSSLSPRAVVHDDDRLPAGVSAAPGGGAGRACDGYLILLADDPQGSQLQPHGQSAGSRFIHVLEAASGRLVTSFDVDAAASGFLATCASVWQVRPEAGVSIDVDGGGPGGGVGPPPWERLMGGGGGGSGLLNDDDGGEVDLGEEGVHGGDGGGGGGGEVLMGDAREALPPGHLWQRRLWDQGGGWEAAEHEALQVAELAAAAAAPPAAGGAEEHREAARGAAAADAAAADPFMVEDWELEPLMAGGEAAAAAAALAAAAADANQPQEPPPEQPHMHRWRWQGERAGAPAVAAAFDVEEFLRELDEQRGAAAAAAPAAAGIGADGEGRRGMDMEEPWRRMRHFVGFLGQVPAAARPGGGGSSAATAAAGDNTRRARPAGTPAVLLAVGCSGQGGGEVMVLQMVPALLQLLPRLRGGDGASSAATAATAAAAAAADSPNGSPSLDKLGDDWFTWPVARRRSPLQHWLGRMAGNAAAAAAATAVPPPPPPPLLPAREAVAVANASDGAEEQAPPPPSSAAAAAVRTAAAADDSGGLPTTRVVHLQVVHRLLLARPVTAVCPYDAETLVVAAGRRLLIYALRCGRLHRMGWTPTRNSVTAMSACPARSLLACTDGTTGVMLYTAVHAGYGTGASAMAVGPPIALRLIAADAVHRPVTSLLLLPPPPPQLQPSRSASDASVSNAGGGGVAAAASPSGEPMDTAPGAADGQPDATTATATDAAAAAAAEMDCVVIAATDSSGQLLMLAPGPPSSGLPCRTLVVVAAAQCPDTGLRLRAHLPRPVPRYNQARPFQPGAPALLLAGLSGAVHVVRPCPEAAVPLLVLLERALAGYWAVRHVTGGRHRCIGEAAVEDVDDVAGRWWWWCHQHHPGVLDGDLLEQLLDLPRPMGLQVLKGVPPGALTAALAAARTGLDALYHRAVAEADSRLQAMTLREDREGGPQQPQQQPQQQQVPAPNGLLLAGRDSELGFGASPAGGEEESLDLVLQVLQEVLLLPP